MGNVMPTYIKSLGEQLIKKYGEKFSNDFDENKRVVTELTDIESKNIRNRVAGYITRLKRREGRNFNYDSNYV